MKKLIAFFIIITFISACGKKSLETSPEKKDITETVFASGIIEPENKYNLTAQTEGYLIAVNFKESDIVKEGDVLAIIDNKQNAYNSKAAEELLSIANLNTSANAPALKQTEVNIAIATEKLKQDEIQFNRYKKLLESNSVSKLEYETVSLAYQSSKANLEALKQAYNLQRSQAEQQLITQQAQKNVNEYFTNNNQIKAVIGGKIYRKNKEPGDYIRKGDVIAVIGNANNIYARLNIDESNISKIKTGQKAIVQLNTNKAKNYNGTVYEILPAFDDASQSFICKVKFTEEPELKIAGTQLQANIIIGTKKSALVIPRNYLGYGNKVKVKGRDEPVIIKTGFISSEWVEVSEGLSVEDIIETEKIN